MRGSGEEVFATLPAIGVLPVNPSHLHPVCGVSYNIRNRRQSCSVGAQGEGKDDKAQASFHLWLKPRD